jgi:DNA-binding GntR family transcriptional regulator
MSPQQVPKRPETPRLRPLESRTLVDQVVDAIVEATATGVFLPGDRIVEAEVARALNVSRIPVREALRILESQGIVVNARYRSMRLMDVSIDRLEKVLKVRLALETLAVRELLEKCGRDRTVLQPLEDIVQQMHLAAGRNDSYGVARLDTAFHRTICTLSGNEVLLGLWETLSRQLTIIFGLSTLQKDLHLIAAEHDALLKELQAGNAARLQALMKVHILDYSRALDYEEIVRRQRSAKPDRPAKPAASRSRGEA